MKEEVNYKEMSDADLKNRGVDIRSEFVEAKRKWRLGQFKKTSEFSRLRKEIARIETFLQARKIASQKTTGVK